MQNNSTTRLANTEVNYSEPQTLAEWHAKYSRVPYYKADWELLKRLAIKEHRSYRSIAREFNIARNTIKKYVSTDAKRIRRPQPVRDQWRDTVRKLLTYHSANSDTSELTAKWIFSLLVEKHGYKGSERTVRTLLLECRDTASSGGNNN